MPFYAYGDNHFFSSDDAPAGIAERRRAALQRLGQTLRERAPKSIALTAETAVGVSDMQFTSAYRVPYQYAGLLREHVRTGSFVQSAAGVTVTDLDGNVY